MGFFRCLKERLKYMKTIIEELVFPESIKTKLKRKVGHGNLHLSFGFLQKIYVIL